MLMQIPIWFFGLDSAVYLICSLMALFVSYSALQLYELSKNRNHFCLYLSFAILGLGMFALSLSGLIMFSSAVVFPVPQQVVSGVDDLGYWIYYSSSILGYLLLIYTYFNNKFKHAGFIIPAWPLVFVHFNLISVFLLSFVVYATATNYLKKRNFSSLLVLGGFGLITFHHILLLFLPFSNVIYLVSHALMLIGLSLLVWMLRKVK